MWLKPGIIAAGTTGITASFTQPYNYIFIPNLGDSRRQEGGGLSGQYGVSTGQNNTTANSNESGIDAVLAPWLDNRIRFGETRNVGIGATRPEEIWEWPRSIIKGTFAGRIDNGTPGNAGNIFTLTTPGTGGGTIQAGNMVIRTATGLTGSPKITAILTGTGGVGTYTIDGPAQSVAQTSDVDIAWINTNTIAEIASNPAAIVVTMAGTNGNGAPLSLAAMDTMLQGLTTPGFPYPGYRPNGESTDQPLPLYNSQPKTILLYNETRKGVDVNGNVIPAQQLSGSDATQFFNYAQTLKRYAWNSGDPTYQNAHIIVADTFNDPRMADLTDTVHYDNLPGLAPDGLHLSPPAPWLMAQVMRDAVGNLFDDNPSFAKLPTTDNSADWLVPNSVFATTTGGTATLTGGNTISLDSVDKTSTPSAAVPASWIFSMSGNGLNADIHYNALGGNLGNEMVIHITGTPAAATLAWLRNVSTTGLKATVNLSTDTLRFSVRTKLLITSGLVINYSTGLTMGVTSPAANGYSSEQNLTGSAGGYGNQPADLMLLKNNYADISHSNYLTMVTPNVSLTNDTNLEANMTPNTLQPNISLNFNAGAAVDVTLTISQPGVFKVGN